MAVVTLTKGKISEKRYGTYANSNTVSKLDICSWEMAVSIFVKSSIIDVWQGIKYASEDLFFTLVYTLDKRVAQKMTAVDNVLSSKILRFLVTL